MLGMRLPFCQFRASVLDPAQFGSYFNGKVCSALHSMCLVELVHAVKREKFGVKSIEGVVT